MSSGTEQETYSQFARIGKALANPVRLQLLDLLGQGERGVEELAEAAGTKLQNTSAQLQHLRAAQLVTSRKAGTKVYYRLAGPEVGRFLGHLQDLGEARLAEVRDILDTRLAEIADLDPVSADELAAMLADGRDILLLDVRPAVEYAAGHIPGAVSIPTEELHERMRELPAGRDIVAYCRGRYCVSSPTATRLLRAEGRSVRPMPDGISGWKRAGRPVESVREAR
jgi:rhodanese-related sulfurtransferase/DNA-binding transcriptional ArsR family regulator